MVGAQGTTVSGRMEGAPNALFRIEFFASSPSPNQLREARHLIGSFSNPAGAPNGMVSFSETLPIFVPATWRITASATHNLDGTSELSPTIPVGFLDTDGDGMPNAYELVQGLDLATNDAGGDLDGDGITNIDEMKLGTNPRQYSEGLTLGVAAGLSIQFPSQAGRVYRLDSSASPSGPWMPLLHQIQGTGGLIQVSDPIAPFLTRRFYQLVQTP